MLQTDPTRLRSMRRGALAVTGVCALVGGLAVGTSPAFAATDSTFTALQSDFASGPDDIYVGGNITQTDGTLTLGPATGTSGHTTLHLTSGTTLTVQAIELTSNQGGVMTPSTLVVTGSGKLVLAQTDPSLPAIEVSSGSSLTISSGTVIASVPSASTAAAIGGGPTAGPGPQDAGSLIFNGLANVTATGGDQGAAIGGGYGGAATVAIDDSAVVLASVTGRAAAIGAGSGSGSGTVTVQHDADVTAHQYGTGITGAAVGGGASPAGQISGSVTVGDEGSLTATSLGRGAAIGGGYHGDGGTIGATGYAHISATSAQAAIGDGELATNGGSSISFSGLGVQVQAHGGTNTSAGSGGAGIGGSVNAFGNDSLTVGGGATVTTTSDNGPGIGGLGNSVSMSVSIGTATVSATGGSSGAGIGAGSSTSIGTSLSIADSGVVTVAGVGTAIGGSNAARFGSMSSSGALTVASGNSLIVPSGATVSSSGTYTNSGTTTVNGTFSNTGTITNSGTINGTGTLDNQGTILQNGALSTSSITGNNFDLNYDPQSGTASTGEQRVFAPSVSAAGLILPTASPTAVGSFTGWNASTDGTGATLRSGTGITSDFGASGSSDGKPVTVRAYAQYQLSPVLPASGTLAQGVVGTPYSASVAVTSGTAPISYTYTGSLPAGLTVNGSTGAITGTPTTMGTFTMHLTATNALTSATHDYSIQIVPTPITLSVPTTSKGSSWYLAGSTASLRIGNLQTNETYTVKIGGKVAATGKASSNTAFTLRVTIPKSIGDGSQTVEVSGGVHAASATSKILTASVSKALSLKLSAKKVKHGKKVVITISKLYAGESARVVVSGKHGKTAVGKATSKGVYVVTLKTGLAKGKYTVTVTGAGTGRKASAKLTVS